MKRLFEELIERYITRLYSIYIECIRKVMNMRRMGLSIKRSIQLSFVAVFILITVTVSIYSASIYRYSKNRLKKNHEELTLLVDRQVETLMQSFDSTAKRIAYAAGVQALVFTGNPTEFLRNYSSGIAFFESAADERTVRDIFVHCETGNDVFYQADWETRRRYVGWIKERDLESSLKAPHFFTASYPDPADQAGRTIATALIYYIPMHNVRRPQMPEPKVAQCLLICNIEAFVNILSTGVYEDETIALFYDNQLISSNHSQPPTYVMGDALRNIPDGFSGTTTIGGKRYLCDRLALADAELWSVLYLVPEDALLQPITNVRNISVAVLFLSLFALSIFLESVMRGIYAQVNQLSLEIQAVTRGKKKAVDLPALLELKPVATNFNEAIASAVESQHKERDMTHKLYQSMLAHQQAAITSYRYQITPHFLFNIMETMRSLAHRNGADELETLIRSTARFLRYMLRENAIVPLGKELKFIRLYFDIMQSRYPHRFSLRVGASQEAEQCGILATALQPLVENSVTHGALPGRPLAILIQAAVVARDGRPFLFLRVTDNGKGMSPEMIAALEKHIRQSDAYQAQSHIGLSNVYHRLSLHFGVGFSMDVRSREGCYCSVSLYLPQTAVPPGDASSISS